MLKELGLIICLIGKTGAHGAKAEDYRCAA